MDMLKALHVDARRKGVSDAMDNFMVMSSVRVDR
jgi:hypothetical protein